jgi:hypothetical protein
MKILFFSISIVLALMACTEEQDTNSALVENRIELNSEEVKRAIIEYRQRIVADNMKEILRGDSLFVGVVVKYINDSVTRWVLYPINEYSYFKYISPFQISNVEGHDVFISIIGSQKYQHMGDTTLTLPENVYRSLVKKYYPRRYSDLDYQGMRKVIRKIYEPSNCYLTFINGKFVDKTYQRGSDVNTIPIVINSDTIWY